MHPTSRRSAAVPLPLAFTLAFLALALAAPAAAAGTATLVRDIRPNLSLVPCPGCQPAEPGSSPSQAVSLGSLAVFLAFEPSSGTELWATDGTASGTLQVADACPGPCSPNNIFSLGRAGGFSFWHVDRTLWRSDGTRAGTGPLLAAGSSLELVFELDFFGDETLSTGILANRLYVNACNDVGDCGLWRTDGTGPGTRLVFEAPEGTLSRIRVGTTRLFFLQGGFVWGSNGTPEGTTALSSQRFDVRFLTAAGDRLFFTSLAHPGGGGDELWVADAAGVQPLTAFAAEEPFHATQGLVASGGHIYFAADDVVHGHELWTSDGTVAGTRRITDFGFFEPFGSDGLDPGFLQVLGNRVLFPASDGLTSTRLWRTDGTPASTAPVAEIAFFGSRARLGDRLVFALERDVWVTDGTAQGTFALTDSPCCSSAVVGDFSRPGEAFFVSGGAAWRTDGTREGTRRITDRTFPVLFPPMAMLGSDLLFAAQDRYGIELWASNGRRDGTRMVANLAGSFTWGSEPADLAAVGGRVLFTADAGSNAGRDLWASGGTAESTLRLADVFQFCTDCSLSTHLTAGGLAFVLAFNASFDSPRLFRTDGTPAGTALLFDPSQNQFLGGAAVLGERLYFVVSNAGGSRLWRSDGTAEGTDPWSDLGAVSVEAFAAVGPLLYMVTLDAGGYTLWASDGTDPAPRRLLDLPPDSHFPTFPIPVGNIGATMYLIFLEEADFNDVYALWKSDGTAAGTSRVTTLDLASDAAIGEMVEHQGALYFVTFPEFHFGQIQLWRTDGTAAGTSVVATFPDLGFDAPRPGPFDLTSFGDRLYFALDDGEHGRELWASDGTPGGTGLLRDVNPGLPSGEVSGLVAAGGRLYFAAADPVHGIELWQSDGTAPGTRLVHDVAPLGASSSPAGMTVAGDRLYWGADDGLHGRELWTLPLAGPASCQPTMTRLCLGNGRFAVEAEWQDFQGNRGPGRAAALTADTGYFWFFSESNVEVILKVLDGRGLNEHFWVFFGALSSVEYTVTVTDTSTGLTRRYFNPSGRLGSVADTHGFGPLGAFGSTTLTAAAPAAGRASAAPLLVSERSVATAKAVCVPSATRLCLNGGRFAVEAAWEDFQGNRGKGQAVGLTGDTGYFWFFSQSNVEVVLKVLDGRPVNGKFWVFYGALSTVEYTLTVTDTETGAERTYENPSGRLASSADTGAF